MDKKIYLDNNATTGVDPCVLEAMLPELGILPANPSSVHYFGQEARKRLTEARHTISDFLKVKPHELIFTSGGTEALNMLIHGFFKDSPKGHILTSSIEHSSVFHAIRELEQKGCEATYLPVGLYGAVRPEELQAAIRPTTKLIVLSAVNSETGVKNDLEILSDLAEAAGVPLIIDAVALIGKERFLIPHGVSAMAFSAHKFHGPKGVGLAFARSSLKFSPLLLGGSQEYSRRAGTENLPGIIGMAKAIELLKYELPDATQRMQQLRDHFEKELKTHLDVVINGEGPRVANTSNLSFPQIDGETLLMKLDLAGIAASHGSACASGALEPSRVLTNMGIEHKRARSALRFSLSRWTTREEIDTCIQVLISLIKK